MTLRMRLLAIALVLPAVGCQSLMPPPPEEIGLWPDAAANIDDWSLADLAESFWHGWLQAHPEEASHLGDPRFADRLTDNSPSGRTAWRNRLWGYQSDLEAIPFQTLTVSDLRTARLLERRIEQELTRLEVDLEAFTVDPLWGPQVSFASLLAEQAAVGPRERAAYLARLEAVPVYLRRAGDSLRRSSADGRVPHTRAIEKVVQQIDRALAVPPLLSEYIAPAVGAGRMVPLGPDDSLAGLAMGELGSSEAAEKLRTLNPHVMEGGVRALGTHVLIPAVDDPLPPGKRGALLGKAHERIADGIYPALASYRALLREELLPKARTDAKAGLGWLPRGRADYAKLVEVHTGQSFDPTAIHVQGLRAVDEIHEEILALGSELFGARSHQELLVALERTPGLRFETADQIVEAAEAALGRAEASSSRWIERPPVARCEVVPIPAAEAPESTIAYYRQPAPDFSRPGRYYVNTSAPETRPRWQAEVLAFHEAVPGHHTQIALAQELDALPAFRRYLGSTAFVEGWALYVESLADELGLYSGDLDRLGALSFAAWRAARLVVDTGLHHEGWTRDQAVRYLREHTLLTEANIQNEVDRYLVWPGQALAYWLGAEEFHGLRRLAEQRLGDRFRLPEFHSELLRHGPVEPSVLREIVSEWVARRAVAAAGSGG